MNVDLMMQGYKELNEEKQRYKEMWFTANNSLAKYRNIEEELGCPLEDAAKALKVIKKLKLINLDELAELDNETITQEEIDSVNMVLGNEQKN